MIKKHLVLSFLTLLFSVSISAQSEVLSKEEAVALVLENNLGIQVAQNIRKIDENNANTLNSGYLPTVAINGGTGINRENTEGQLASGEVRTANGVETRRYNASLDIGYTLFDGLGRYYNFKSFKERSKQSELEVRQTIENTVLQLFTVYYEAARLTENAATLKTALEISKERLKRAQYQFEFGQNTGLDVLNAEVDINTDSINLVNSRQELRNTKRDLNLILSRELNINFEADTTVAFVPGLQMEGVFEEAKQNNVQLLLAEQDILISKFDWKASKSGYLPTIGLTGSYGWNQVNNNNPLAFVLQNTTFGVSGGINLTWNIFDGGRTITTTKNARLVYDNQALVKKQIDQEVERDIQNAWDSYQNAQYVLQVQDKNLQTNQNNFTRTNERYKLGLITSIEFRQAQLNFLNAKLARSGAKFTAKLAELQLLLVSGQLLNIDF